MISPNHRMVRAQSLPCLHGAILLAVAGIWCYAACAARCAARHQRRAGHHPHASGPESRPSVIEDQVTYPIVTALLAAPRVQSVRAQTMFGDSYVFVVFRGWHRSLLGALAGDGISAADRREASGRCASRPSAPTPPARAGCMNTPSSIARHTTASPISAHSRIGICAIRLETVPGVAEVASIGGFVRQYQVNLDPNKLLSYGIPASTVIDKVRESTNEVGGDVLELSGAEYMIRGLGYLRSLSDLENVPVATKNGTPVLVRDLGDGLVRPGYAARRGRLAGRGRNRRRHCRHARWHERAECDRWREAAKLREIAPIAPARSRDRRPVTTAPG